MSDDSECQTQIVIFEHLCSVQRVTLGSRFLVQGFAEAGVIDKSQILQLKNLINEIKGSKPKPLVGDYHQLMQQKSDLQDGDQNGLALTKFQSQDPNRLQTGRSNNSNISANSGALSARGLKREQSLSQQKRVEKLKQLKERTNPQDGKDEKAAQQEIAQAPVTMSNMSPSQGGDNLQSRSMVLEGQHRLTQKDFCSLFDRMSGKWRRNLIMNFTKIQNEDEFVLREEQEFLKLSSFGNDINFAVPSDNDESIPIVLDASNNKDVNFANKLDLFGSKDKKSMIKSKHVDRYGFDDLRPIEDQIEPIDIDDVSCPDFKIPDDDSKSNNVSGFYMHRNPNFTRIDEDLPLNKTGVVGVDVAGRKVPSYRPVTAEKRYTSQGGAAFRNTDKRSKRALHQPFDENELSEGHEDISDANCIPGIDSNVCKMIHNGESIRTGNDTADFVDNKKNESKSEFGKLPNIEDDNSSSNLENKIPKQEPLETQMFDPNAVSHNDMLQLLNNKQKHFSTRNLLTTNQLTAKKNSQNSEPSDSIEAKNRHQLYAKEQGKSLGQSQMGLNLMDSNDFISQVQQQHEEQRLETEMNNEVSLDDVRINVGAFDDEVKLAEADESHHGPQTKKDVSQKASGRGEPADSALQKEQSDINQEELLTPGSAVDKKAVVDAKTPLFGEKDVERTPENDEANDFANASKSTLQHTTKGEKTASTAEPKSIKKGGKSSNRKKNCGCCLVQ